MTEEVSLRMTEEVSLRMTEEVSLRMTKKIFAVQKNIRIFARLKKRKAFWCNGVFETED